MTALPRPLEGKIRFSTPNPWDDPLFHSAIRGPEREQRRAQMQASIDKVEARRVGGQYRDEPTSPAPETPAALVPVTSDATGARSERWACPGCSWSSDKGSAIAGHKRNCAGLYERRKASASTATPPKPGPAYTCPECGIGATSQASLRGHRLAEHKEAVAAAVAKVDALLDDPKTVVVADFNDEPEPEAGPVPVAREHIQADTPTPAPACPIGEPAAPTATAEEGEKGMTAKAKTKRPCGCGGDGRHRSTCPLAKKTTPTPAACEACGKPFPSEAARNGHLKHCLKRKGAKGAAPPVAGPPAATFTTRLEKALEAHQAALPPSSPDRFITLGTSIGELVARKNVAYGDSFAKAGDFLRLLFPERILPEQYGDALALVRVFDKQMRIATAKDALGESPWTDIAGYGLLGASRATTGAKTEARG